MTDLRNHLIRHPLLNNLTDRQLDAIVAITNGDLTVPRLPVEGEIWHGDTSHRVEVLSIDDNDERVRYRVLTVVDGLTLKRSPSPWRTSMRDFLESFDPPPEPVTTVASGDMAVELPVSADKVVDLMAALEASIAAAKDTRLRSVVVPPTSELPDPDVDR